AQDAKGLPAAAADVENRRSTPQVVDVAALPLADRVDAAAHAALEGEVVGQRRGGRLGRDRDGRHGRESAARAAATLDPGQTLLELAQQLLGPRVRRSCRVGALRERIDELQQRAVVDTLVGRGGLDVPGPPL